jgi:hypothetical protein
MLSVGMLIVGVPKRPDYRMFWTHKMNSTRLFLAISMIWNLSKMVLNKIKRNIFVGHNILYCNECYQLHLSVVPGTLTDGKASSVDLLIKIAFC